MKKARILRSLAWLGLFGLLLLGCPNPFSAKPPENRSRHAADARTSREAAFPAPASALPASAASSDLPAGMQVMPFEQNLDSNLGPEQFVAYVYEGTSYAYYSDAIKKYGQYSITGIDDANSFSLLQRPYNLPAVQSQGFVAMPQKDLHCAFWLFVPSTGENKQLFLQTTQKNISWPVYYHVMLQVHNTSSSGQLSIGLTVQKREDYGSTQTAAAYAAASVAVADQSWHLIEYWFDKNQGSSGRSHLFFDGTEVASGDVTGVSLYDPSDLYDGDGGENSQQVDMRVMNGACADDFMWNMLLDRSTADHEALHAAIEAYRLSGLPWGSGLPQNLLQLYASAAEVPGGATLLGSYFGLFPRITADPGLLGTTGGSASHDGALHGSSGSFFTQYASGLISAQYTWLFPSGYSFGSGFSHQHLVPAHSHSVVADHLPPCFDLVPASGTAAGAGALFLFHGSAVPEGWTAYTQNDARYLRFNSDAGTAGSPSHQHQISLTTSSFSAGGSRRAWTDSRWIRSHAHTYIHRHPLANDPKYRTIRLIRRGDGQAVSGLSELPSGTIALFNTAELPAGWTLLGGTEEEGSLLKHNAAAAGLHGGSVTHAHAPAGFYEQVTNLIVLATRRTGRLFSGGYVMGGHSHSVPPHGHSGAVDWMPPFVYLFAARKE